MILISSTRTPDEDHKLKLLLSGLVRGGLESRAPAAILAAGVEEVAMSARKNVSEWDARMGYVGGLPPHPD